MVANGDIKSEEDVLKVKELTNVDGKSTMYSWYPSLQWLLEVILSFFEKFIGCYSNDISDLPLNHVNIAVNKANFN